MTLHLLLRRVPLLLAGFAGVVAVYDLWFATIILFAGAAILQDHLEQKFQ